MCTAYLIIMLIAIQTFCKVTSLRDNYTSNGPILISEYTKVSRVGAVNENNRANHSRGQAAGYRSMNISTFIPIGNARYNFSKNMKTYSSDQYPNNGYSTIDESLINDGREKAVVDSIDRYNPRPYFSYGANSGESKPSNPSYVYAAPSITLTSDQDTNDQSKNQPPNEIISYTPPPGYKADTPPPTAATPPEKDSYASALDSLNIPSAMDNRPALVDSYNPPPSGNTNAHIPPDFDSYVYPPNEYQKPQMVTDTESEMPSDVQKPMMSMGHEPPDKDTAAPPPPVYLDYDPNDHGGYHHHHVPKLVDFPDDHHFHDDHHVVYHEVTTTTTEAPKMHEDERVNKKPYSYYYLGRKLWYLPLYFSLYFIVYIFALIVKSIFRHKVEFPNSHDWTQFKESRASRELHNEIVNTATENVHRGLTKYHM